jgi:hypothetical protein
MITGWSPTPANPFGPLFEEPEQALFFHGDSIFHPPRPA